MCKKRPDAESRVAARTQTIRAFRFALRQALLINYKQRRSTMLRWALIFLAVAVVAAIFGFSGVAGVATNIAWVLFVVFLILFVVSLIMGRRTTV